MTPIFKNFVDKNGKILKNGDLVLCHTSYNGLEKGRILYNKNAEEWQIMFLYSMWYGTDEFDYNSYGKAYTLENCNGEDIELIKEE